jgi:hypothetical protein
MDKQEILDYAKRNNGTMNVNVLGTMLDNYAGGAFNGFDTFDFLELVPGFDPNNPQPVYALQSKEIYAQFKPYVDNNTPLYFTATIDGIVGKTLCKMFWYVPAMGEESPEGLVLIFDFVHFVTTNVTTICVKIANKDSGR